MCHPQTLHGKRVARYLSGGTCGRGGRSWSPPPALPVPRAQVYATSLEWGLATGAGGRVCTEGPAGWIGGLNRPPPSRARGTPCGPQSCLTQVQSRATQQPPDGRRLPGAGPGLKQAGGSGGRMKSQPLGRPLAQGQGVAEKFGIFSCLRLASGGEPSGGTCPFCFPHLSLSGLEQQLPTPRSGIEG